MVGEFNVYVYDSRGTREDAFYYAISPNYFHSSEEITRDVLLNFARGYGHYVDMYMVGKDDIDDMNRSVEDMKQRFRERLSNIIHVLTGTEPTLRREKNGRWYIYF